MRRPVARAGEVSLAVVFGATERATIGASRELSSSTSLEGLGLRAALRPH